MGMSELLWACRRRWRLIVAMLALALAVGWLTTPAHANNTQPKKKVSYHATEILLPSGGVSLDRLALLATAGAVPNHVRAVFHVKAQPNSDAEVSGKGVRRVSIGRTAVAVSIDRGGKALRFTATDTDPKRAVQVAQTFAAWLTTAANADSQAQFNTAFHALDDYRVQLETAEKSLNSQLNLAVAASAPTVGTLTAQHNAVIRQLSDTQERILKLEDSKPTTSPLQELQKATAVREVASSGLGLSAPKSALARLLLAAVFGLLLGLAGAVLLNRKSETVYGVPSVEAATLLPVDLRDPVHQRRREAPLRRPDPGRSRLEDRRGVSRPAHDDLDDVDREHEARGRDRRRNAPTCPAS